MLTSTLLLFNLDGPEGDALKALCGRISIGWAAVGPEDYAKTLGELVGLPARSRPAFAAPRMPFTDPMLVMANLTRAQFDALLQGMRQAGVRVPLKAVLTPSNVAWNAYELRDELAREHEAVTRGAGT